MTQFIGESLQMIDRQGLTFVADHIVMCGRHGALVYALTDDAEVQPVNERATRIMSQICEVREETILR